MNRISNFLFLLLLSNFLSSNVLAVHISKIKSKDSIKKCPSGQKLVKNPNYPHTKNGCGPESKAFFGKNSKKTSATWLKNLINAAIIMIYVMGLVIRIRTNVILIS
jgi:hypothetical protein